MRAFEFVSVVNNNAIVIPQQYQGQISSDMRVIVLADEEMVSKRPVSFSALQLQTKGIKFDREGANER